LEGYRFAFFVFLPTKVQKFIKQHPGQKRTEDFIRALCFRKFQRKVFLQKVDFQE